MRSSYIPLGGTLDAPTPMNDAGVHFPPPFLYVAGFVAGWLLDRAWPLRIAVGASAARLLTASLFLLVWLGLMVWALATFRRAHTTLVPNRPASALATNGPYRVTRNPMYVSLAALYVGASLLVNSWWPFIFLPLVVLAVQQFVIAREERYLTSAFPVEYPAYCGRVRRWI
jgi:protein-S-isoprenylcysteine O-methyltransferase Ste14